MVTKESRDLVKASKKTDFSLMAKAVYWLLLLVLILTILVNI